MTAQPSTPSATSFAEPEGSRYAGLRDARSTDRLTVYLGEIWRRRAWSWYVSSSELRSRQINSVLGSIWHVLGPLLQIGVFFIFFGLVLDTQRGVDNFIGFLTVGIFVYTFSQKCAMTGAKSLLKYRRLMQIVTFPRALVPLTTSLTESLASLPAYAVMFVVLLATGEPPRLEWFLIVPLFVMQAVFGAGLGLIAARAAHHFADVQQLLPFVFRLGFYASGVLFNVESYIEGKEWRSLVELNPLYCFIEMNRALLLNDRPFDFSLFVSAAIWTVSVSVFGLLWFRRAEDAYGDS